MPIRKFVEPYRIENQRGEKGCLHAYFILLLTFPANGPAPTELSVIAEAKSKPPKQVGCFGGFCAGAERVVLSKHERYKTIFALVVEYQMYSSIYILF